MNCLRRAVCRSGNLRAGMSGSKTDIGGTDQRIAGSIALLSSTFRQQIAPPPPNAHMRSQMPNPSDGSRLRVQIQKASGLSKASSSHWQKSPCMNHMPLWATYAHRLDNPLRAGWRNLESATAFINARLRSISLPIRLRSLRTASNKRGRVKQQRHHRTKSGLVVSLRR